MARKAKGKQGAPRTAKRVRVKRHTRSPRGDNRGKPRVLVKKHERRRPRR